jgi:hypothetical protein
MLDILIHMICCVTFIIRFKIGKIPFDGLENKFLLEPKTKMDQKQPRCKVKYNLDHFEEWIHKSMILFPP